MMTRGIRIDAPTVWKSRRLLEEGLAMDMYVGETAAGSQGEIVPFEDAVLLQAKLVKRSSLRIYPAYPHGCLL
jgi:hypothetical protein